MVAEDIRIRVQETKRSRLPEVDIYNTKFGHKFSDHMFIADFRDGDWRDAQIVPFEKIPMSPATSVFHYGQAIFEGMKAYKSDKGEVYLFRPWDNAERFNRSATRLCMPTVPKELFIEGLSQLISLDRNWIPASDGSSLYIRPVMFSTDEFIGVKSSDSYKFIIISSPSGVYYKEPIRVRVETHYTRACEGGTGSAKAAGNYAASLYPAKLSQAKGYHQLIWTDAKEHKYIEESGTMNVMFVIGDTLVTPALHDSILAGITRDSVITIAKDWGMRVEERKVSVDEIIEAHRNGLLAEAFGVGTAATIAQIIGINYKDHDHPLPPVEQREFSGKIGKYLTDLRRGKAKDKFGWMMKLD